MGGSSSRLEEDKGLQLCRARKKFIKQALNGRCSVAAAHISYIEELKILGVALRRFVELLAQVGSFNYPSRSVTPEPSQIDGTADTSPSLTPRVLSHCDSHHMKFSTTLSKKIEEEHPTSVSVTVITPHSSDAPETSFETPAWDFFGLFDPVEDQFSSQGVRGIDESFEYSDGGKDKFLSPQIEESQESEDEFDEPSSATLVRSFKNINREMIHDVNLDSPYMAPEAPPITKLPSFDVSKAEELLVNEDSTILSSESVTSETKFVNGKSNNSPDLSQTKQTSSGSVHLNDVNRKPVITEFEDKMTPKEDNVSIMKNIEYLFFKASESGKEVPRMLEAHKFHFRPVYPEKASGAVVSPLIKSCFSCGPDPKEIQEEPPQNSMKYLTWPRTASSRYASSQNLLDAKSFDDPVDPRKNLFDNFCMVSGSHASTLDRLYAWEKKLYDEVKASQVLRSHFDQKCKFLRLQESRGHTSEKARSVVKDLHSRIRVSIHRINSISKKIEEIRDEELQPQLEELIEGLIRMWETMLECHNLQLQIATIPHRPGSTKLTVHSVSQRQITINLENELNSLSSIFTKWVGAQKIYIEAIDKWLFKCVLLPQNTSKRNKRMKPPPIRNCGPPIYMICGAWLAMINELPCKGVVDSIKDLTAEVAHFLPHQEKSSGNGMNHSYRTSLSDGPDGDHGVHMSKDKAVDDHAAVFDRFRTRLVGFLGCLNSFAECSVKKFAELQKAIQEAKNNHEHLKSQQKEISSEF